MECSFIRDTLDIEPHLSSDGIGLAPPNRGSSHHKYKTSAGHVQNFPSPTFFRWNIQPQSREDSPAFAWQGFFIWLRSRNMPIFKAWNTAMISHCSPSAGKWLLPMASMALQHLLIFLTRPQKCAKHEFCPVAFESSDSCFLDNTSHWLTSTKYSQDFVLYRMMGSLVYIHLCFTG